MRRHWQRRPLLVRQAWPSVMPPLARVDLFALAAREGVESRLVVREAGRGRDAQAWQVRHGPIPRRALPPLGRPGWTLLVQGLDLHVGAAHEMLQGFRFVPAARLDDLMVSWASPGGGVGPHVDSYDVFLLQVQGRRRWRVAPPDAAAGFVEGLPLKILRRFEPQHEWLLEPGDMLYLPPGVAHDGTAVGDGCLTYSIGFRTPTWAELLDPWFARFAEHASLPGRYADPGLAPARHPGRLPAGMVTAVHEALSTARPSRGDTERFLLEYLTEPKGNVVFERVDVVPTLAAFTRRVRRDGLRLDRRTRMLVGGMGIALNGELVPTPASWRPVLHQLADRRDLGGAALGTAPGGLMTLLREWWAAGWMHVGHPERNCGGG